MKVNKFIKSLILFIILIFFLNITKCDGVKIEVPDVNPLPLGKFVNPFVGTGGIPWACGFTFPGATTPFGMVRLSPDTSTFNISIENMHTSGYYYGDTHILGFSHTRLSGTGATEGGLFMVIPSIGPISTKIKRDGLWTPFSHKEEVATPGYYAVALQELGILAELTATKRVGFHRYTFKKNVNPHIFINVSNVLGEGKATECEVRIFPEKQEVEGSARIFGDFSGRYGGLKAYFVAKFDKEFSSFGTWNIDTFYPNKTEEFGDDIGAEFDFPKSNELQEITLKVAISYVSIDGARGNLEVEGETYSFDEIKIKASEEWEKALSSIIVQGGSEDEKKIFYTALYHSLIMPTIFNDIDSQYTGFDKEIHFADGFDYYTDISLWDTFRTVHPLLVLIEPLIQRDIVISLIKMAEQGGFLPRWPSGTGYTNSMLGTPADIVITDTYIKGITDFDVSLAYNFMLKTALGPTPSNSPFSGREGITYCLEYKYCPSDLMEEAVSRTLEFAYSDYAISNLAKALQKEEDSNYFKNRALYYKNTWNKETLYFQPRESDGNFFEPFYPLLLTYLDPTGKYTNDYVEGSPLQWRWYVPYDILGLISLFQSKEQFIEELNNFFAFSNEDVGSPYPGPYYWHGNEPDIHSAYMFNYAGRQDLTAYWSRWILKNKYNPYEDGLDGNDDAGTLSAWYVLSSLGFYPIAGTDIYLIGSPLFKEAKIDLKNGNFLIISAENYSFENIYVESLFINEKRIENPWFYHNDIKNGGKLKFVMSKEPKNWAK